MRWIIASAFCTLMPLMYNNNNNNNNNNNTNKISKITIMIQNV